MLKTFGYIVLILAIIFFLILLIINWNKIFSSAKQEPKEGDKCIFSSEPIYIEGVIKDGKCILSTSIIVPNNEPAPVTDDLEVINPTGAYLYYQQPLQSGGLIYSKSNVIIPKGTKLTWVKTWPDTSTWNKFFYETDYQSASKNGFFKAGDIKKK